MKNINYNAIDPLIRNFVREINSFPIVERTINSCQGHSEKRYPNPYIGIEFKSNELRNKFIIKLVEQYSFTIGAEGSNVVFIYSTFEPTIKEKREMLIKVILSVLKEI